MKRRSATRWPTMDSPRRMRSFGVAQFENGSGFDRAEAEANRCRDNDATEGSEGRRRECTEIGRAFCKGRPQTSPMKMLVEYLERAVALEKLSATGPSDAFKGELLRQAAAYRELAAKRADEYGLPPPSPQKFLAKARTSIS